MVCQKIEHALGVFALERTQTGRFSRGAVQALLVVAAIYSGDPSPTPGTFPSALYLLCFQRSVSIVSYHSNPQCANRPGHSKTRGKNP